MLSIDLDQSLICQKELKERAKHKKFWKILEDVENFYRVIAEVVMSNDEFKKGCREEWKTEYIQLYSDRS